MVPRISRGPEWCIEARVDDGVQVPARVWRQALGRPHRGDSFGGAATSTPTLIVGGGRDELLLRATLMPSPPPLPGSE